MKNHFNHVAVLEHKKGLQKKYKIAKKVSQKATGKYHKAKAQVKAVHTLEITDKAAVNKIKYQKAKLVSQKSTAKYQKAKTQVKAVHKMKKTVKTLITLEKKDLKKNWKFKPVHV